MVKKYSFSEASLNNLAGVDERLKACAHRALSVSPFDFGIPSTGGVRTAEMQHELFINNKSACDGFKYLSKHQKGLALDFYAYVDGRASWEEYHLAMIGAAFLQAANTLDVNLIWGGLWKSFKDYPHVELECRATIAGASY